MSSVSDSYLVLQTTVRGYHIYQAVWIPTIGEDFVSLHESGNAADSHAMGIFCNTTPGLLVGHLPKEISRYCHYFTIHDGKIRGEVTGPRQHCTEKGGMEIPCLLTFSGIIRTLKNFFEGLHSPTAMFNIIIFHSCFEFIKNEILTVIFQLRYRFLNHQ